MQKPFPFCFPLACKVESQPLETEPCAQDAHPADGRPQDVGAPLVALSLPCSRDLEQAHGGRATCQWWAGAGHCSSATHSTGPGLRAFSRPESSAQTLWAENVCRSQRAQAALGARAQRTEPLTQLTAVIWLCSPTRETEKSMMRPWRHWPHQCTLQRERAWSWRDQRPTRVAALGSTRADRVVSGNGFEF